MRTSQWLPSGRTTLRTSAIVLALAATSACKDAGPTSLPSASTPVLPGAASAAKGETKWSTPDGKGIGTLDTRGVDRTRYRLEYHGGLIAPATSNVYLIWYGNWANDPAQTILTDLAISLGGSSYFAINRLYSDATGRSPSGGLIYGGAVNDLYSRGPTLSDQDIKSIVLDQLATSGLPTDPRGIYVVLASPDVWASSGQGVSYCAFHDSLNLNGGLMRLAYIPSPSRAPTRCAPQTTSPNGDYNADGMASLMAAELFNVTVDPYFNAYYDRLGLEPADKCAWDFGPTYTAPNGSQANIRLGNRDYLLQRLWVPTKNGGYCALATP